MDRQNDPRAKDQRIQFLKNPVPHRAYYSDPCPCSYQRAKNFVGKNTLNFVCETDSRI